MTMSSSRRLLYTTWASFTIIVGLAIGGPIPSMALSETLSHIPPSNSMVSSSAHVVPNGVPSLVEVGPASQNLNAQRQSIQLLSRLEPYRELTIPEENFGNTRRILGARRGGTIGMASSLPRERKGKNSKAISQTMPKFMNLLSFGFLPFFLKVFHGRYF